MDKDKAESEIDYRMAVLVLSYLADEITITDETAGIIRNRFIDEFKPFIGCLERDM